MIAASDRELLDRAAWWPRLRSWRELSVPVLREVSRHAGIEFATALLYDRIVHSPEHGPFIRALAAPTGRAPVPRTRIVLIPGACYREYPETGADGGRLRDSLRERGTHLDIVPVESYGHPAANARLIIDWFRVRADESTLVVSLSKGAAELRLALTHPDAPAVFRNVRGWVSISGSPFGTALAGWLLRRPFYRIVVRYLCWRHGYSFQVVETMDRRDDGPLAGAFAVPPHLRTVHLLGFPLFRHLRTKRARLGYRRLAAQGPNDAAGNLLGDVVRLPGLLCPLWGIDHYMEPAAHVQPLVDRLLHFLSDGDDVTPGLPLGQPINVS